MFLVRVQKEPKARPDILDAWLARISHWHKHVHHLPEEWVDWMDWFAMGRSVWFLASNKQTKPSSSVESPTMNGACLGS